MTTAVPVVKSTGSTRVNKDQATVVVKGADASKDNWTAQKGARLLSGVDAQGLKVSKQLVPDTALGSTAYATGPQTQGGEDIWRK